MSIDSSLRPTVGRDIELAQFDDALAALDRGGAPCVAVEGEPGIGKTRLLGELRQRGEERGHLVLSGAAAEFERDLPFGVWIDALDAYVASQERERELVDDELAAILPSLRRAEPAPPSGADERYRAHRSMRSLLELLAARKPLVLVLDDLHWADGASIELIAALLRRVPDAPVLLALAFRPGQAPERLTAALAVPHVARIALGPLSEADSELLLPALEPAAVAAIYRHGGGNPFYLEQLARGGADALGADGVAGDGGVPAAVAASLAEEVGALSPPERALLEAAAVAGEPFEPDLAAAIAELSPAAGLDALDSLLALDLLRPTAEPRRFVFRHPLVRRAVYESARGGWRLAAHARAAALLEERGAAAAERAPHVEHYASQGDEAAVAVLLEAGDAAAARAPSAAARWYALALPLLPAGDAERQVSVRVALASALRAVGELARCRDVLLEAIELLPPHSAERIELTALCVAVEHWLGNHDDAHRRIERAWEDLPDQAGPAAAILQMERAVDAIYELDFDRAIAMGAAALSAARESDDRGLIAATAAVLALCHAIAGDIPAARECLENVLSEVERLTDAELAPRVDLFYYLGWTLNYVERYDDAIAYVDRGLAIARAIGGGRRCLPMRLVKGFPLEMQGRMAEARELCETAVEATRLSASPHELYWALFELAWAHYYSGDPDSAIAACDESIRVDPRMGKATIPSAGGGPGWALGSALFLRGDIDEAERVIGALGDDTLAHKIPVERCFDWEVFTLLELARGRVERAAEYAARSEAHAATLDVHLPTAIAGRTRAAVLMAQGEPAEAARVAAVSADHATKAGARLQAAFSRGLAGQALAAAGEREQAIAALRAAERELDECGCIRPRDELRRDLRRLGARAEVRGPATPGDSGVTSLTDRERGIADLVTDRKTNKEIAAELFLSTKTVEAHLRNIFVKLDVSSRVDVARVIERDRSARG